MLPCVWGLSDVVDVPAGCYAAAELAQRLSHGAVQVSIDGALTDRGFAIRLRKRSFADIDRMLSEAAGLRLVHIADDKWRLVPDPEAEKQDRRLFVHYTAKIDTTIREAVQAAISIAGPNLPPKLMQVQDGLRKRYSFSNAPTRGLEIALDDKPGPESEKNGWRLLAGLSGSAAFICSVTPPAFEWARQGGSVESLIRQDAWLTGDLATWQDNAQLAPWAREHALESLRFEEERLAADKNLDAAERRRQLATAARSILRIHRLHFEPRNGRFWSESGWMDSRTFGGGGMAYEQPFYFAPGLSVDLLRAITKSKPEIEALEARIVKTRILAPELGSDASRNLSDRALHYAEAHDRDVVLEIQPVRELFGGNRIAPLAGVDEDKQRGRYLAQGAQFWLNQAKTGAYTAQIDDGALILRDEWRFLDRKYRIPMADALVLRRKLAECRSDAELLRVAAKAKVSTVEAALRSGFELAPGVTENWPVMAALASRRSADPALDRDLANELVARLRRWHELSIAASPFSSSERMNLLMPIGAIKLSILPTGAGTIFAEVRFNSLERTALQNGIAWRAVIESPRH